MRSKLFIFVALTLAVSRPAFGRFDFGADVEAWCQMESSTYQRTYCEAYIDRYTSALLNERDADGKSCVLVYKAYAKDRIRRAVLKLLLIDAPGKYDNHHNAIVIRQAMVNAEMISETCASHSGWSNYWQDRIF